MEIVVPHGHAYRYDLAKQTHTVFTRYGDTTVHSHRTDNERKHVFRQFYHLGLDAIPGQWSVADNCVMMTNIYSVPEVKSTHQSQEMAIGEICCQRQKNCGFPAIQQGNAL